MFSESSADHSPGWKYREGSLYRTVARISSSKSEVQTYGEPAYEGLLPSA
jgi:hypothetical protein